MLAQQHTAELLKAGGRIVERAKDQLAVLDGEGQHLDLASVRVLQLVAEVAVDEAGEFEHELIAGALADHQERPPACNS
jgi:hypothetical protein